MSGPFGTYRDQLMFEILWSVRCEEEPLNRAARRAGVDWATARRWTERLEARLARRDELDGLCHEGWSETVQDWRGHRAWGIEPWGAMEPTESDSRWFRSARAAELLYVLRDRRVISAAEYARRVPELTRRNAVHTELWEVHISNLALMLSAEP